jgi:hypothetical protein
MNKLALYIHNNETIVERALDEFEELEMPQKVVLFNNALDIYCDLPMMHGKNLYYWDGPVIATCMLTALFLLRCPCVKKEEKFLYVDSCKTWNDEWDAKRVLEVFHNLRIISKDPSVKTVWNVEPLESMKAI